MADAAKKTVRRTHTVGTPASATVDSDVETYDDDAPMQTVSLFEALKSELSREVEVDDYPLDIPMRPEMALVFRPQVEWDIFQTWVKRATDKKTSDVDYMKLSVTVISNLNIGITLNGQPVSSPDGEQLRITSREIHQFLNVPIGSTQQAIRKLYIKDGHAIQAMRLVVEKCGYSVDGDVAEVEDSPLDS